MSSWTYVTGSILVEAESRTDAETLYIVQTVANHLPRITGSEGDVDLYIQLLRGRSLSSNRDEFMQESNLWHRESFGCGVFETQSCAIVTINGSLRDRIFSETLIETQKMLFRLSKQLLILNISVTVSGYDKEFTFTDQNGALKNNFLFGDTQNDTVRLQPVQK